MIKLGLQKEYRKKRKWNNLYVTYTHTSIHDFTIWYLINETGLTKKKMFNGKFRSCNVTFIFHDLLLFFFFFFYNLIINSLTTVYVAKLIKATLHRRSIAVVYSALKACFNLEIFKSKLLLIFLGYKLAYPFF